VASAQLRGQALPRAGRVQADAWSRLIPVLGDSWIAKRDRRLGAAGSRANRCPLRSWAQRRDRLPSRAWGTWPTSLFLQVRSLCKLQRRATASAQGRASAPPGRQNQVLPPAPL